MPISFLIAPKKKRGKKWLILQKADFYGLFAAVSEISFKQIIVSRAVRRMRKLEKEIEDDLLSDTASNYYDTVIEGVNKKAKRERRIQILQKLLTS